MTIEVVIAPSALEAMREKFSATEDERNAIRTVLTALKNSTTRPSDWVTSAGPPIGYRIAFMEPPTFRIDVGRFRVHYRVKDATVQVIYIGVY